METKRNRASACWFCAITTLEGRRGYFWSAATCENGYNA